jgi:hypothetical protein
MEKRVMWIVIDEKVIPIYRQCIKKNGYAK